LKLTALLSALPEFKSEKKSSSVSLHLESHSSVEVQGITADARQVRPGFVFVAIPGTQTDGHQYLPQACEAGAMAVVVEKRDLVPPSFAGVVLVVESTRAILGSLASQFYNNPSSQLFCFGVTGTNGKTSITYMLETILEKVRIPCGVLGTTGHHLGTEHWSTEVTTPGPVVLQQRLAEMKEAGARAVAMEVSSHALEQNRVDGVNFNTVIFTNLTQDHLDYHSSMEEYFHTKQRLFTEVLRRTNKNPHFAVVNIDDPWGARLRVDGYAGLWSYGKKKSADFCYRIVDMDFSRTDFELRTPFGFYYGSLPMCGEHNVANAIGAVAAAASGGVEVSTALEALARFPGVPGRLQTIENDKGLHVFVDYAHSPDALENVLRALGQVRKKIKSSGNIWTVFGCGGDRDKGKRPLMAQAAEKGSDFLVVTSDNPRTENPQVIVQEIVNGLSSQGHAENVFVEVDRKEALALVFKKAKPNDVILIAGKGHEDYQIVGTNKIHFSDVEIAKELLA